MDVWNCWMDSLEAGRCNWLFLGRKPLAKWKLAKSLWSMSGESIPNRRIPNGSGISLWMGILPLHSMRILGQHGEMDAWEIAGISG